MTPDDHVDNSIWYHWFKEFGVFMSNAVLEQMSKDIALEQISRQIEESETRQKRRT